MFDRSPDLSQKVLGFRRWHLAWVLDPDQPSQPTPPTFPPGGSASPAPPNPYYPPGSSQPYYPPPPQQGPWQVNIASWGPAPPEPRYHLVNGDRVPTLRPEGYGTGGLWHPGANRARCAIANARYSGTKEPHAAPAPGCSCGLYALHDGQRQINHGLAGNLALGAIAAWGRLEVHKDGFRAEYSQILVLAYDPAQGVALERRIRLTADAFDVPCVPIDDLLDAVRGLAEPLPEKWYGEDELKGYGEGKSKTVTASA